MVLENNWFWSTFILERQLLNLNDPIFCCCFLSLVCLFVLLCFACLRGSVSRSECFGFCCFFFLVPLKSLDKEINELTAEIEVRKILTGRYVTSLFKVDSLTRIHTIFFELFFFGRF